jgi:hypothetical protein
MAVGKPNYNIKLMNKYYLSAEVDDIELVKTLFPSWQGYI